MRDEAAAWKAIQACWNYGAHVEAWHEAKITTVEREARDAYVHPESKLYYPRRDNGDND